MSSEVAQQGVLLAAPAPARRPVALAGVSHPVARVLLDSPVPHLDRTFDYLVPAGLDAAAQVGTRVVVRLGGQEIHGWVWERGDTTTHAGRLAPLRRVVSDLPVLTRATRTLVEAVAERAAGTRADVVRLAVPARHADAEATERAADPPALPDWGLPAPSPTGWRAYDGGPGFLAALAAGGAPRAVACVLPGGPQVDPWEELLAQAARTTLASGRGVLVLVPTTAQAEALAARLGQELPREGVAVLSAEHGARHRYRTVVRILLGRARVGVGTRAAAFAPVADLGLAVVWDDGDDRLDEPRAPYTHARTVVALRAGAERCGLLLAGYSRSVEAQSYVEAGWAREVAAPRALVRRAVARVQVPGPELEAEGASGAARVPSLAHRALREALRGGPVLVQVPRGGYVPVVACAACRAAARCALCSGPLGMDRDGTTTCRWCARRTRDWSCPACGATGLRMVGVGSARTGEELGRAFPGVPVLVSGAREDHGVVATVDDEPRLVVATPGAEPAAPGGYGAVLLLDAATLSARPELGATSEALRLWSNAVALARPGARVILLGGPEPGAAQALLRWDQAGYARRELAERAGLHLPPAWRAARLDGPRRSVERLLAAGAAQGFEVLGPVPAPGGGGEPSRGEQLRALLRAPRSRGRDLAGMLRLRLREASVHREEPVRCELDPTLLW